jgi:hypothetical protein
MRQSKRQLSKSCEWRASCSSQLLPMYAIIIAPLAVIGTGLAFFAWRLSVDIHREKQFRSELSGSGFQHTLS